MRAIVGAGLVACILLLAMIPAGAEGFTVRMNGDVIIPTGTVLDGTVITMNGRIQVDGTVQGDAMTMNGDITVAGGVTGSVRTLNGTIQLTSTARVDGDVWAINGRVDRQPGAQIGGRIDQGWVFRSRPRTEPFSPQDTMRPWISWAFFRVLMTWLLVGFVILAAAIAALFPQSIQRVSSMLSDAPGQALLAGVLLWVALPPFSAALVVSIIGLPALVLVPLALNVLGLVGFAAAAMLLGNRITQGFRWHLSPVADAVVGAAILAALALIPGLGWLAFFVALTWGMGGILLAVFRRGPQLPVSSPPSVQA